MLDRLKADLGLDPENASKDNDLNRIIEKITRKVLNYCNIDAVPTELEETVIDMCIECYEDKATIKSMTKGDTSFEYGASSIEVLMKDYKSELNRFRKMRW